MSQLRYSFNNVSHLGKLSELRFIKDLISAVRISTSPTTWKSETPTPIFEKTQLLQTYLNNIILINEFTTVLSTLLCVLVVACATSGTAIYRMCVPDPPEAGEASRSKTRRRKGDAT
ncbi:unnamed protein product [Nezara viridula]|uniref:Uncharacterized protein n=1 Tax=Nezara viridula TaxID=85310 RepID=A0A9P0HBN8_NEZVI|nr:unnamed protein product [Nezara viridula]